MTYARARLWLGISTVGLWVVLATSLLATTDVWTPYLHSFSCWEASFIAVSAYILLSAPFDWLGGHFLPKHYQRSTLSFLSYGLQWLRGSIVHGALLLLAMYGLCSLIQTFSYAQSLLPILLVVFAFHCAQIVWQPLIARMLAPFKSTPLSSKEALWDCEDPGFTGALLLKGGFSILPKRWQETLSNQEFQLIQQRREVLNLAKPRLMGIVKAMGFTLFGVLMTHWLLGLWQLTPEAVGVLPFLLCWSSLSSLWSFLGLVTLPTPSQWASLWADHAWVEQDRTTVERLIRQLDAWQDEEPQRSPGVQRIFHPIPNVEQRLANLDKTDAGNEGCYHLARHALYFSWPSLSWLSRAVHCNVGRPHLWVFFPADA